MTRREHLVELLIRYPETLPAPTLGGFGNDGTPRPPEVWFSRQVQELERSLSVLWARDETAYRHVKARYVTCPRVQLRLRKRGDRLVGLPARSQLVVSAQAGEKPVMVHGYALVSAVAITWPEWVNNDRVEDGLCVLEQAYRGEPELPEAFVRVAA